MMTTTMRNTKHLPRIACVLFVGCVLPLPYEVNPDGPSNSPPVIRSSNPAMPGPVTFSASAPQIFSIEVEDLDVTDTLYVRVFRNYQLGAPTPPVYRSQKGNDPQTGTVLRSLTLPTHTFCAGENTPGLTLYFQILIADRDFLDDAQSPAFLALPDDAQSTSGYWFGTCTP